MAVPTGAASLSDIQTEFGGSNPISLSEYYGLVSNPSGIPSSGAISINDFRGKENVFTLTSDTFTSSKTLAASDINGSLGAWVGVSGGGGGGAGVVYGLFARGTGAGGGAGGDFGFFVSDVTTLIGASFTVGAAGAGSVSSGTPGSFGYSVTGGTGGTSTLSFTGVSISCTGGTGGRGYTGGQGGSGTAGTAGTGSGSGVTDIDVAASIASFYSGKYVTGPQGIAPSAGGAAGPVVVTGDGGTPGSSTGGTGAVGKLVIIYEAPYQV
jgi:hypothetical protein